MYKVSNINTSVARKLAEIIIQPVAIIKTTIWKLYTQKNEKILL